MKIMLYFLYFTLLLISGCSKPANRENSAIIYKTGTYSASTKGYGGDLTIEVNFSNNFILAVKVIEHNETEWIGDQAITSLPDNITKEQRWNADTVAGATITSEAIKTAVRDCIRQATVKNKAYYIINKCLLDKSTLRYWYYTTFASEYGQQLLKKLDILEGYEAKIHILLGYVDGEYLSVKPRKENRVEWVL